MIIQAKTKDSHLAIVAGALSPEKLTKTTTDCVAKVVTNLAYLKARDWSDNKNPGRPYLQIQGECIGLVGDFPFEMNELKFNKGSGIPVAMFYEFSDEELSSLVLKGLYHPGFTCPEVIQQNDYEIPVVCDLVIVNPNELDKNDRPITFADIIERQNIELTYENSGYALEEYFTQITPVVSEQKDRETSVVWQHATMIDEFRKAAESEIVIPKVEPIVRDFEESSDDVIIGKHYMNVDTRVRENHLLKTREEVEELINKWGNREDIEPNFVEELKESLDTTDNPETIEMITQLVETNEDNDVAISNPKVVPNEFTEIADEKQSEPSLGE